MYGTLAALVVLAHFAYILFVMFGGLLMLRWRRAPWVHLPAATWGAFVELTGRICPITPLGTGSGVRPEAAITPVRSLSTISCGSFTLLA